MIGPSNRVFQQLDADHDGTVSEAEFVALFKQADANHDGSLTGGELAATMRRTLLASFARPGAGAAPSEPKADDQPQGPGAGRPGRGPRGAGGRPGFRGMASIEMIFTRLDKNQDGSLTKDEVPEMVWQRLSQADTNSDGAISKEEVEAFRKLRRPGQPATDAPAETTPEAK